MSSIASFSSLMAAAMLFTPRLIHVSTAATLCYYQAK